MIRNHISPFVFGILALITAVGCSDASASDSVGGKCAQVCERADSCPNVEAEDDCIEVCEEAVQAAASLGGTCPGAVDDVIACQTQLSCGELFARALGGFYNDECIAREQTANRCIPGDPIYPSPGSTDELLLACQSLCDAGDDCPNLVPDSDCVQGCYQAFREFEDGTPACSEALVDTVNCQSALSCEALTDRVNSRARVDSCTDSDRVAETLCF